MFFPETGVTVIEEGKEKKGDRNYFQKYHKYSKYDYINLLVKNLFKNNFLMNFVNKTPNIHYMQRIREKIT